MDPTPAGAQPMGYADRWWITYNGEIYNFRELRRELESEGERFRTECDTEVLLRLFVSRTRDARAAERNLRVRDLGRREKRLFLARDRLGVKPLYYTHGAATGLPSHPSCGRCCRSRCARARPTALADYLTFLWVPDPKTASGRSRSCRRVITRGWP